MNTGIVSIGTSVRICFLNGRKINRTERIHRLKRKNDILFEGLVSTLDTHGTYVFTFKYYYLCFCPIYIHVRLLSILLIT